MNESNLPADPASLILGIAALVLSFAGCFCYGLVAIVPLIMGIIGLILASKSLKIYRNNPEAYSPQTKSNVSTAKLLSIIAIIFNGLIILVFIGILVSFGAMKRSGAFGGFNLDDFELEENFEIERDTLFNNSEDYENQETLDTITVDPL